jgi:hypothetical protein
VLASLYGEKSRFQASNPFLAPMTFCISRRWKANVERHKTLKTLDGQKVIGLKKIQNKESTSS